MGGEKRLSCWPYQQWILVCDATLFAQQGEGGGEIRANHAFQHVNGQHAALLLSVNTLMHGT